MKRIAIITLALLIFATLFCGCSGGQQVTNLTTKEPEIVNLTVSNIEQYVAFSVDVTDVKKFEAATVERCTAKLTVKTSSKQKVEFKNLTVTFKLLPESSYEGKGWDSVCCYGSNEEFVETLDIPYSGIWEETFKIQSEADYYVGENPTLKFVVTQVTGQAIVE